MERALFERARDRIVDSGELSDLQGLHVKQSKDLAPKNHDEMDPALQAVFERVEVPRANRQTLADLESPQDSQRVVSNDDGQEPKTETVSDLIEADNEADGSFLPELPEDKENGTGLPF